jgi:ArsR family transcriptional regulator
MDVDAAGPTAATTTATTTATTDAVACCAPLLRAPLDEAAAIELAEVLKAIADPVRLRLVSIVATAAAGEICACDLPALVERSQPTVSHHLSVLVKAGILAREQRGKWAWFRLHPERLDASASVVVGAIRDDPDRAPVV